ncbi:antA/AntB antirepressor family protein [Salinicola avicenniae]|uniref:antA/AntB antirepressor family protein n=1 Tax=Salinicola avicenniae TaxID=2916836 RepID=UPI002073D16F|nr:MULTISPECIES: antA/AntB antirepressor family protein [unclassified Salinicola]
MATQATTALPVFTGSIEQEAAHLVDARTLHRFLEVETHFRTWISRRIDEYGFAENQDFLVAQNCATKGRGGDRRSKDYHLTLDMAKELSMVERNEKGKQARRYFIECEKRLHAQDPEGGRRIAQETIGTDGLHMLRELIAKKVRPLPGAVRPGAQRRLWSLVHTRFNVPKGELIAANDLDAAANFVASVAIEGEYLEASSRQRALPGTGAPTGSREAETLYYSLIAWQHHVQVLSRDFEQIIRPVMSRSAPELCERWAKRFDTIDNCAGECIALARRPLGASAIPARPSVPTNQRQMLASHAAVLEREFVEIVGPAIRPLNRQLYGNWRERIGVLSRYLRDAAER